MRNIDHEDERERERERERKRGRLGFEGRLATRENKV